MPPRTAHYWTVQQEQTAFKLRYKPATWCIRCILLQSTVYLSCSEIRNAELPLQLLTERQALASPHGVLATAGGVVDIQGVCKSTVAKGEDDFPNGVLRVTDCHDSVIYALAPLQYASVACCSDCTVVVGAVGRMLRVERCERLQLVAGCVSICISSCHDCVFYLGVNRPPLLLGDNRFVQV